MYCGFPFTMYTPGGRGKGERERGKREGTRQREKREGRRGEEGVAIALLNKVKRPGFEKGKVPHRPQLTQQ